MSFPCCSHRSFLQLHNISYLRAQKASSQSVCILINMAVSAARVVATIARYKTIARTTGMGIFVLLLLRFRISVLRFLDFTSPGGTWRVLTLLLALFNLKSLPLGWHVRIPHSSRAGDKTVANVQKTQELIHITPKGPSPWHMDQSAFTQDLSPTFLAVRNHDHDQSHASRRV